MAIKLFVSLFVIVCQGWQHFLSFNDECGADFNLFRGTRLETTASVGRLPYQFLYSWQQVLRDRVAAANCIFNADTYEALFGLKAINLVRLLDSSDTKLNRTFFPPTCSESNFNFHWKSVKEDFQGLNMPTSCSAAKFAKDGICDFRVQILDELNIEISIRDTCTTESDTGFGLPQFSISCNGTLCDYVGKPCVVDSECGRGLNCDSLGANVSSSGSLLKSLGFADVASCPETLFSGLLNSLAWLMGFTDTLGTTVYSEYRMCGVNKLSHLVPASEATASTFTCNGVVLNFSSMCNGTQECMDGFDEDSVSCGCDRGQWFDSGLERCCPICPSAFSSCPNKFCGNQTTPGLTVPNCTWISNASKYQCDWLKPTSVDFDKLPPKQQMSYVRSDNPATQQILFWSDCDGNMQIGNQNALGVVNMRLPVHVVLTELQRVINASTVCRKNTTADLKKAFFAWGLEFWGGVFFEDLTKTQPDTPGASLDGTFRWSNSSQELVSGGCRNCSIIENGKQDYEACGCYVAKPPLANLAGAPITCNNITLAYDNPECAFSLAVTQWFTTLPNTWKDSATNLKVQAESSCSSVFPSILATCEGDVNASGCELMRWAFIVPPDGKCPATYSTKDLTSSLTDFFFNNPPIDVTDTTMINTLNLIATQDFHFTFPGFPPSPSVLFVSPSGSGSRQVCLFNDDIVKTNVENWIKDTYSESTGAPNLNPGGTLFPCSGDCTPTFPKVRKCKPTGCPLSLSEFDAVVVSAAPLLVASSPLLLVAVLLL